MAQNYKVYFANRPVFFAQSGQEASSRLPGAAFINSCGKLDTMLIEQAFARGAKAAYLTCENVEESWRAFTSQFEFVQAAGGLVFNDDGKMLFIYRLEKWDLPKGKVEDDESVREGAVREVEEECSIFGLEQHEEICVTWHTYIQHGTPMLKATSWYKMLYHGNQTPQPQTMEGITDVRWLGFDELAIVRANTYPSVLDVINAIHQD